MKNWKADPETGCWNWTGHINPQGYGVACANGKTYRAHVGFNLHAICNSHGEHAYIERGSEAESIKRFMGRHAARTCRVEWAVDNTYSTPYWAEKDSGLYLPDDLRAIESEGTKQG